MLSDILPFFSMSLKKFGSLFHLKILARHYIILNNPDDIKVWLSQDTILCFITMYIMTLTITCLKASIALTIQKIQI